MKTHSETHKIAYYSPFWPVLLVFLTLVSLQVTYVINDLRVRANLKAGHEQLAKAVERAETITKRTENVGRELLALSADKSTEANKIVSEFNIRLNAPPTPKEATEAPSAKREGSSEK